MSGTQVFSQVSEAMRSTIKVVLVPGISWLMPRLPEGDTYLLCLCGLHQSDMSTICPRADAKYVCHASPRALQICCQASSKYPTFHLQCRNCHTSMTLLPFACSWCIAQLKLDFSRPSRLPCVGTEYDVEDGLGQAFQELLNVGMRPYSQLFLSETPQKDDS